MVIDEFRSDPTQTRKDGTPGHTRIQYTDPHDLSEPITWLWRFVDGARTAGELYGRALVVICAEPYASRLVVPQSQRTPAMQWPSRKDHARKALNKLAAPHLPASLGQLRKPVEHAHREASRAVDAASDHGEKDGAASAISVDRGDDVPEPTLRRRATRGRRLTPVPTRHPRMTSP